LKRPIRSVARRLAPALRQQGKDQPNLKAPGRPEVVPTVKQPVTVEKEALRGKLGLVGAAGAFITNRGSGRDARNREGRQLGGGTAPAKPNGRGTTPSTNPPEPPSAGSAVSRSSAPEFPVAGFFTPVSGPAQSIGSHVPGGTRPVHRSAVSGNPPSIVSNRRPEPGHPSFHRRRSAQSPFVPRRWFPHPPVPPSAGSTIHGHAGPTRSAIPVRRVEVPTSTGPAIHRFAIPTRFQSRAFTVPGPRTSIVRNFQQLHP